MSTTPQGAQASRAGLWAVLVAIALVAAVVIWTRVQAQREEDIRVDELYCTLEGVTLFDEGPRTGRLCVDLLTD